MTTHVTTRRGLRSAFTRRTRTTRTIAAGLGTLLVAGAAFGGALGASAAEGDAPEQTALTGYLTTAPVTVPMEYVPSGGSPYYGDFTPDFDTTLGVFKRVEVHAAVRAEGSSTLKGYDASATELHFEPYINASFIAMRGTTMEFHHKFDRFDAPTQTIDVVPGEAAPYAWDVETEFGPLWYTPDAISTTIPLMQFQVSSGIATTDGTGPYGEDRVISGPVTYSVEYSPYAHTEAPTVSLPTCGERQVVIPADSDGIDYTVEYNGDEAIVTASVQEWYTLAPGTETMWILELDDIVQCPTYAYALTVSDEEAIAAQDTVDVFVHVSEVESPKRAAAVVTIETDLGEITPAVLDESGSFYMATLSSEVAGTATVTFSVDGIESEQSEQVVFTAPKVTEPTTPEAPKGNLPATGGTDVPVGPIAAIAGLLALMGSAFLIFGRKNRRETAN